MQVNIQMITFRSIYQICNCWGNSTRLRRPTYAVMGSQKKCIYKKSNAFLRQLHFLLFLIYFVAVFEPEQTMRTGGEIYGLYKTTGGLILEHADLIHLDLYRLFRYVLFDGLTPSIFSEGTIFFMGQNSVFQYMSQNNINVFFHFKALKGYFE